mmetsp:Transcript_6495/g.8436  ORF Transcript_6495/g.8436 Transcript_6495/m.8436 type:complete len:315 (-) Transcript_6495:466-1410(-)
MLEAYLECDVISYERALEEALGDSSSPYQHVALLCAFYVFVTFVVSTASQNYSQVDKIWSIAPFVYTWFAVVDKRTLLMAVLATIWGIRLTYNFARRGGYTWPPWKGDEDYRWAIIKRGNFVPILKEPIPWIIFNFGFVSLYQNMLLLLIATPSLVAYTVAKECPDSFQELNALDGFAAFYFLTFVIIETIADNQQYKFQTEKYRRLAAGEPLTGEYADGFCQSGMFAIVRKPNYAAEQAIWVSFYFLGAAATKNPLNWTAIGSILLALLFQGSGWFTENITQQRYEKYSDYMDRVALYIPDLYKIFANKKKND